MSGLSPEARELVRAGRAALRPSDADRERVLQALLPQLGGGSGPETLGPSAPSAVSSGTIVKVVAALVAIGAMGGGLFLALRKEPPPPRPPVNAPAPSAAEPAPPVAPVPESAPSAPQAEPAKKRVSVPARPADSLAEEVGILSRASAELHAGRPAAALAVLEEHRRRFPRGVLAQESSSARVQALCALGRMREGQAELSRLARTSPNSPYVARARKACGAEATTKE